MFFKGVKMTQSCKGTCSKYKRNISPYLGSMYLTGHVRCTICQTFLKWEGLYCPCCGARVSKKPKNMKAYNKLVKVKRY